MKVIRLSYMFILFISSIVSVYAQSEPISFEDQYIKCYDTNFMDNGKVLRKFIQNSEKSLIDANILKGISGKNYLYFLNNSGTYTSIDYSKLGFVKFMLGQLSAGNFNLEKFQACKKELITKEAYKNAKMYHVDEILKKIKTVTNVQDVTTKVAKILTAEDFEHIYYKLRIINFLELHGSKSLKKPNEKVVLNNEELKNALKIHIKAQDEIVINNKEVSFGELLQETKMYVQKSASKTLIVLKVEEDISKQFITAIKNEISKVIHAFQDELAMKKYKRSFDELIQIEQEEIQKSYPKNIVQGNF